MIQRLKETKATVLIKIRSVNKKASGNIGLHGNSNMYECRGLLYCIIYHTQVHVALQTTKNVHRHLVQFNISNEAHHTIWSTDRKQGQPYTPHNLVYRQETRATIYTIQSGLHTGNKNNHIHHTIWSTDRKQEQPYTPYNLVYRQETSATIYTVNLNV